jgi:hypothetical protein
VKRSEVKRSEVVYIQDRDSSDYVATSYRLDGPGSFPGSIFILFYSVFSVFFSCVLCILCVSFLCSCTCIVLSNSCDVLCCFLVECMFFVNTATGHKTNRS